MSLTRAFLGGKRGRQRVEMHQSHLLVLTIIILVAGSHQKPFKETEHHP